MGKLKALYEAEWPAKKIAVEFGVTEGAVWNAVHRMKKQEEKEEIFNHFGEPNGMVKESGGGK